MTKFILFFMWPFTASFLVAQELAPLEATSSVIDIREKSVVKLYLLKVDQEAVQKILNYEVSDPISKKIQESMGDLFEKKKESQVRSLIKETKVREGTAFFIDRDQLLTAHHLVKNDSPEEHVVIFQKKSGEYFLAQEIKCGDKRNIDLCAYKTEKESDHFFPTTSRALGKGHELYSFGYCSEDLTMQESTVSERRSDIHQFLNLPRDEDWAQLNIGVEVIIHEGEQCLGSSGGPLFDRFGDLHGVLAVRYFPRRGDVINTAVSIKEINNFLNSKSE